MVRVYHRDICRLTRQALACVAPIVANLQQQAQSALPAQAHEYNDAMSRRLKRTVVHAWIAFFAVLFSALAPSLSHAAAAWAGASATAEVCTAAGIMLVPLAEPGQTDKSGNSGAQGLEHCAFCSTDAGSLALPPPATTVLAVLAGHEPFPPLFYSAPRPLSCWTSANPRAPPASA